MIFDIARALYSKHATRTRVAVSVIYGTSGAVLCFQYSPWTIGAMIIAAIVFTVGLGGEVWYNHQLEVAKKVRERIEQSMKPLPKMESGKAFVNNASAFVGPLTSLLNGVSTTALRQYALMQQKKRQAEVEALKGAQWSKEQIGEMIRQIYQK
jgi:hypothetical protein